MALKFLKLTSFVNEILFTFHNISAINDFESRDWFGVSEPVFKPSKDVKSPTYVV